MSKKCIMSKKSISSIRNCQIRTGDKDETLFDFNNEGRAVVRLDAYLIAPLALFTPRQIKMAIKKWNARPGRSAIGRTKPIFKMKRART